MFVVDNAILTQYIIGKIHQLLEYCPNTCDAFSDVPQIVGTSNPIRSSTPTHLKGQNRNPSEATFNVLSVDPTPGTIRCIFSLALQVLNALENHHFK